jgi:hypothetical protein
MDKLKNELIFRVQPAMARLVESLRVASLVACDDRGLAIDSLFVEAQALAMRVMEAVNA